MATQSGRFTSVREGPLRESHKQPCQPAAKDSIQRLLRLHTDLLVLLRLGDLPAIQGGKIRVAAARPGLTRLGGAPTGLLRVDATFGCHVLWSAPPD